MPEQAKNHRGRDPEHGAARVRIALETARAMERAVADGHPADRALAALFRAHRAYGSRDRRFYAETVFALFRWRGWSGTLAEAGPRALVCAHWLEAADPDPALRALAAETGAPFAEAPGWGGLPLAARAEALARAEGRSAAPDLFALAPAWLAAALAPEAGAPETWIEAFQARPPLWLRAVGIDGLQLRERLSGQGIEAHVHPVLSTAVAVDGHPHLPNLARTIGPCFDVQDLSAQAVAACANPLPGEHWWDACAGAGGKTLALAERLGRDGRILATDHRPEALREMERRVRARAGEPAAKISIRLRDATRPSRAGRLFDGVLLDAPCSGIGTWPRNPDARWRTPPDMPEACARTQARLLHAAADAVRPGGRLVYAVCTATRAETHDVIEAFLREHPSFTPDPVPAPLGGAAAALHWIHPAAGPCSGMVVASIRRADPAPA